MDNTTYLMARARVFRPERDYPYLGFGRRHLMETLVATISSAKGRIISISFFQNSRNFLRWIFRFAFCWLYTLFSSRVRRFSMNSMRVELDGVYGFSSSFTDSFWLKVLICEHCSSFGLNPNLSFCPLMLSWITPTPAPMCAVVILKNGLPNMRGIPVLTSMSRMTKSTETKKFRISPEYPWRSPQDDKLIGLLAANTWQ